MEGNPLGFVEGLDVGCERKRGKDDFQVHGLS